MAPAPSRSAATPLTVSQQVNATFDGTLTGTGGLTKTGPSSLGLAGAASNTFTGTTTGDIRRAASREDLECAGHHRGRWSSTAAFVTANFSGQIGDSVPVTVNAPGVLMLAGGAGSFEAIGSLAGNGTVTLTDQTLTVGLNNQSTVFTGTIGGMAAFFSNT